MYPLPMCLSPMCPIPQGAPSLSAVLTMIPLWPCLPLPMCPKLCPCAPLAMWPITHVPHPPRCPISICSINHDTPLTMFAIAHVSYCTWSSTCSHVPTAHVPITHVPHPPRCPISICSINHDTPLPMCPIAHMSKNMLSCQKDGKLSKRCQMSKSQTHGLWRRFTKKNKLT